MAAAYHWPVDISEEDALARLLALNLERAAAGRPGVIWVKGRLEQPVTPLKPFVANVERADRVRVRLACT